MEIKTQYETEKCHENQLFLIKNDLEDWGKYVDDKLKIILDPFKRDFRLKIEPKNRLKDTKSYIFKAIYRSKNYENPIVDIEDKVGTRIVLMTTKDVYEVKELIINNTDEWNSKIGKDYKEEIFHSPEFFSYQSVHIVVSPTTAYSANSELLNKLTCEIQIRTILQHAYSEVSHDSSYKGPYKNDAEIVRHLAKSMALIETTDEYFCRIFDMITDDSRKYRNYLNELIIEFKLFVPEFDKLSVDYDLSEIILKLLEIKDIDLGDLRAFLLHYRSDLNSILSAKNGYIFNQPVILLILYYVYNNEIFIKECWPLSNAILKNIFKISGVSYEHY